MKKCFVESPFTGKKIPGTILGETRKWGLKYYLVEFYSITWQREYFRPSKVTILYDN